MKTAIVYYSMSGNTAYAAEKVAALTGADLIRLEPVRAYPDKGMRKFLWGGRAAVMGETPQLKPYTFDAAAYDWVVLAFPVWASSFAPPIRTLIKENLEGLRGKYIAVLACYAGGGGDKALRKLREALGTDCFGSALLLVDPKDKPAEDNEARIRYFADSLTREPAPQARKTRPRSGDLSG